ncbi:MAG: two-component sensor histidine kinase, partial [Actinomycetota bacterium]|nr:two-component sensor histidine kinase [Actinomycetota bacterium]
MTAPGRRRMSLRVRVTALAAICVGGTVALVSLAGFVTVRTSLYEQLDASLLQRAEALRSATGTQQLIAVPEAIFGAADIQLGVLNGRTGRQQTTGELRLGPDELAVALGKRPPSLRTDAVNDLRVAAVRAGPYTALAVAQPLDTTR